MASSERGRGGTNQGTAQDTQGDQTKKWGKGIVMRLPKGENRDYLCTHICLASETLKVDKKGRSLKQRACTAAIWAEEELAELVWAYKAEVGYRMRDNPPTPIMSPKNPYRASRFPLGRASAEGMFSKDELEASAKGRLKIPDCIVLNATDAELHAMRSKAVADWIKLIPIQGNIKWVVEIKFGRDRLSPNQIEAYREIAGIDSKFRLLEDKDCSCQDDRKKKQSARSYPPLTNPYHPPILRPVQQRAAIRIPFGWMFNNERDFSRDPMPITQFMKSATPLKIAGGALVLVGTVMLAPEAGALLGASRAAQALRSAALAADDLWVLPYALP